MSVCFGCTRRYPGCRSVCPDGFAEELENEERREKAYIERTLTNYQATRIPAMQSQAWKKHLDRLHYEKVQKGVRLH